MVTVSSSRYSMSEKGEEFTDESGDLAMKLLKNNGHVVKARELVSDDREQIEAALERALHMSGVNVVLFTGGTGVSPTDVTIETVRPLLDKEIDGFGELFRSVSYKKIGFPGILSRATAGISHEKLVLCLPGSPDGVKTALNLFIGDIPHIVHVAAGRH
ncbi:MAG: MogA/MoaB family molybdenum cofactor biosynthesis protein [Thaumarchaeota archaeon]|nr:MogA/MoaB family molybdenum cofactor biosynthesis protein [Nitrososphaerota archaeon]